MKKISVFRVALIFGLLLLLPAFTQAQMETQPDASSEAPQEAPQEAPLPAGFVGVRGGSFYLDGRPFKHVGVNTIGLIYHTEGELWRDLYYLRLAGVKQVRVFIANNLFTASETAARLERALNIAYYDHGIRLTVVFTDFYFSTSFANEGGKWINGQWVRGKMCVPGDERFYTTGVLSRAWLRGGFRENYIHFVTHIVGRFAAHPGVFAWEIGNEIKDSEVLNDDAVVNFYTEMAAVIKGADGNHLVATGMMSTRHLGLDETRKDTLYRNPKINYITEHYYDPGDPGDLGDDYLAARYNKPLVIEEYGVHQGVYGRDGVMPRVRQFFSNQYNGPRKPADAVMIWGVEFEYAHGSGDDNVGPLQQNLVNEYIALWQQWAGELDRQNQYVPNVAALRSYNGSYVAAEGGGGGVVNANRPRPLEWETYNIIDLNGGDLVSGDYVNIQTWSGHYLCAEWGGGYELNATRTAAREWETFQVWKVGGSGAIHYGDTVNLRTYNGQHYVVADYTYPNNQVRADRTAAREWERFTLVRP